MFSFDAILFDFDGVLLDSEPVHCECWAAVLETVGVRLTWEFYRGHCIGIDDREMVRMLAAQSDPPRDWNQLWALYPAKKRLFQQRMAANPAFHPALDGLLAELHARHKLAVVSSSAVSEISPLLEAGGLRGHFDTVVGGDDVTRHKPAPEPYLLAASRLGACAPLVVEDSEAGIASGRAAGFEVLPVRSPAELPDLLRQVALGGADPLVRAGRPRPALLPQNQVLAADEKPARGPGAFDAILFDFDGVLLDSEPVHCECWAAVLHPLGVRLTWEVYRDRFVGVVAREMLRVLAAESDPPLDWMELRALYPAKRELFQRRMTANPAFHPALDGLLTALHARYKLAVVSSSGCPEIEPVLEAGKLRHHFDTVVGGGDVRQPKPAPEPYLLAASRLGARAPLVVEDSEAGIASARAAGFEVLCVRGPAEVPDLLRRVVLCT